MLAETIPGNLALTAGSGDAREPHDLAASLGPDPEEAYVTTAEMLRAEGEVRGPDGLDVYTIQGTL